ncbi:MAG: endonuclease/exonuclease/phosphatase family protein [Verrucomicrobiota bacterium]
MTNDKMRRFIKTLLRICIVLFLAIGLWYGYSRAHHAFSPLQIRKLEDPNNGGDSLRVAAYNIAHGRGGVLGASNWDNKSKEDLLTRLDAIAEQISNANLDLIVLNEIDFSTSWSFNINQAEYLAQKCGFAYLLEQPNYLVSLPFYQLNFGNALLSKYPIVKAEPVYFEPYSSLESWFIGNHDGFVADVNLPGGLIQIVAVHLEYRDELTRVKAAKSIASLANQGDMPLIALGDFNSSPSGILAGKENTMTYLFSEDFSPALLDNPEHYTFPSQEPRLKIDWILGKNATLSGGEVIRLAHSDHLMVTAEVLLNTSDKP